MFVNASSHRIDQESAEVPSYRPFSIVCQNDEDDLDFTINTGRGERKLELVEFAPLADYGRSFSTLPLQVDQATKAASLVGLIQKKSLHQGGPDTMLLVYVTEEAFRLDPITIEIARRSLGKDPPKFERVYYVSPHDASTGSADEIYPGKPHHMCGGWTDERLAHTRAKFFHPTEFVHVSEFPMVMWLEHYEVRTMKVRILTPAAW